MQISLNWLNDYVDITGLSTEQVCQALTSIGLEVEGVQASGEIPESVVVGKVLEAQKHPNADSLRLCKVDIGQGEPLRIVCGAPNAREGIFVAVATIGSVLPGDFKIKESKIRGELSQGMLCSSKELGLGEDHDGIIEMSGNLSLGVPYKNAMNLGDTILTLNVTPNRGDCLGHIGVARDLAAKIGKELRIPTIGRHASADSKTCPVKISTAEGCGRFVTLCMDQIKVVKSPGWMQRRLESIGMRPINLIVDCTNYVMMECNQPIHAYDARFLEGKQIEVREAKSGETLVTLDGQTRSLIEGDLLICDSKKPVGLAGVMGGQNSEIRDDSSEIVIEVAYFNPGMIRKTSKRLGLHSEASHRFERSVDIDHSEYVARRTADLIFRCVEDLNKEGAKLPTPRLSSQIVDIYPKKFRPAVISLRPSRVKDVIGYAKVDHDQLRKTLESLKFKFVDHNADRMVFEVPSWRSDVMRECDLIEEVARMIGLDQVPTKLPEMSIRPTEESPYIRFVEHIRVALAASGMAETISFPFISGKIFEQLNISNEHPFFPSVALANARSDEESLLTTSLVPTLVQAVIRGQHHGIRSAKLFEIGRGYFDFRGKKFDYQNYKLWAGLPRKSNMMPPRARDDQKRLTERSWVAGIFASPVSVKGWDVQEQNATFYSGKCAVERLATAVGISEIKYERITATETPWLHPGAAAKVLMNNKFCGYVGELHPKAAYQAGLSHAPVVFELDLETLLDASQKVITISKETFPFPPSSRDVAWLVDKSVTHDAFVKTIADFKEKKLLRNFAVFDLYEGKNLPAGKKSMAYRFDFQSPEATLTDVQVDQELQALVKHVETTLKAEQRT